jgi:hypothetical protein
MSAHGIGYDCGWVSPYTIEGTLEFFLKDNAEHSYPYYDCGESEELFLSMLKGKEEQNDTFKQESVARY